MEEEASINFKALRARFQEEALMAESRASRPAVAGKPKHFPPPGGHCSSVLSSLHMAVEHKAPVVPRVFFRDELRSSAGKRPISFPPHAQPSPTSQTADGDAPSRYFFKDRHMPLVLPVLPKANQGFRKDSKLEAVDLLQTKTKKKSLHLPFKSTRSVKGCSEIGEEPTYADLTCRPASAPGELQSVDRQISDDRASLQGSENMNESTFSNLDITISPPAAENHPDAERRVLSTLEKAKKKFSRQPVMSARPKCSSPERSNEGKAPGFPTKCIHSTNLSLSPPIPPPLNLPNFIYISARPFCKSTTTFKSPLEKHFNKDRANRPFARIGEPNPPSPQRKSLLELWALGPQPTKPPRPPVVNLASHMSGISQDKPSMDASLGMDAASGPNHTESTPVIAPEFPDFETSEIGPVETESVDIIALDLETLDLPAPEVMAPSHFVEPLPDWSDHALNCEQKEVNLCNPGVRPLDPPSFPEPINVSEFPGLIEQWSQSEEANVEPSSCTEEPADGPSTTEEIDQGEHANNFEFGIYQQEIYPTPSDNLYEDVENLCKTTFHQNSRKWKGLKNPYADNNHLKEESGYHKWQKSSRNAGDSGYLSHSQINGKECPSPNSADFKEQKKREKQRLDREKKEQKEREKKENEMKKKFKVTGEEEPLYHAKVTVASKLRKHDLPVKSGDTVSIIRTTNCPKGKWLARDQNRKYGYISVMNVELNIKEMLELGKKAQATGKGNMEADSISIGSSSHPVLTSSFTDDSEEWACEDETVSPSNESLSFPQQSAHLPEISGDHVGAQHTLSDASLDDLHTRTRHEALQKLAIFFQHDKEEADDNSVEAALNLETPNLCDVDEPSLPEQEIDFTEMELLPPPPLYADIF